MNETIGHTDLSWSGGLSVLAETKTPNGYSLEQLTRSQVPGVVTALAEWYPDLRVSAERCHLEPEFYYEHAALAGESIERPVLAVVATSKREIVGVLTLERDLASRTVRCRIGAIAAGHRGPALALLGPMLLERIGRGVGADIVLYYATLRTPHQQVLAERCRFSLVGIVPACDQNYTDSGAVKRVYEAIYAKVLVDRESVVEPPETALTLNTRAVWRALFAGGSE